MSRKVYDLAVVVDTYEKDGQKKNKYQNIGAIIEKDDGGRFMLLERWFSPAGVSNPDNRSNVIVSLFEPKQNTGGGFGQQNGDRQAQQYGQTPRPPQNEGPENFEDDPIPF